MLRKACLSSLVSFLFMLLNGFAQREILTTFKNYSQKDGLSSYNITKIVQDRYGYIWIGTQDGVNCFDGKIFLVFQKESDSHHRLVGNNVTDISEDTKRNTLWISTSLGGITGIDIRTKTVKTSISSNDQNIPFNGQWIHCLAMTGDKLWIGTYGGLYSYDVVTERFQSYNFKLLKSVHGPVPDFTKMVADSFGRIWSFCDGYGIFIIPSDTLSSPYFISSDTLRTGKSNESIRFLNVYSSNHNEIYFSSNRGMGKIDFTNSVYHIIKIGDALNNGEDILSFTMDDRNRIWASTAHKVLRYDQNKKVLEKLSDQNNGPDAWQTSVYVLFTDNQNNIWAGSEEGLSFILNKDHPFERYFRSTISNTRIQHAFSLLKASDSIMFCGAANGLYKVNLDNHHVVELDTGSSVYMIGSISRKEAIVSNADGIFILKDDKLIPASSIYPFLRPIQSELFCAFAKCNDSVFILGSQRQKGVFVINLKKKSITCFNTGNSKIPLDNNVINGFFIDNESKIWVLSINSIFQINPSELDFKSYYLVNPVSKLKCDILFDMCETRESFWFAAYGLGIIESDKHFNVKKIISVDTGLANNGVYKIFQIGDSVILVSTNNGLSKLNIKSGHIENFYETDGLQSNSFEQFCGYRDVKKIYVGGLNGFTGINPSNFSTNPTPPLLYISRVRMEGLRGSIDTSNVSFNTLTVPSSILQTTLFFSVIDYSLHENSTLEYKIAQLGNTWTRINNQHFVNLIGLAPGDYTVTVRAANADGIWSLERQLNLQVLPKWYQSLLFKVSILILLIILTYLFYKYNVAQLTKQQQIRKEIASDLHDDIGSTLNSVKIFTHLAIKEPLKGEHLSNIEESLTQASLGLRDMIWVLDDSRDDIHELVDRIKKYALPVCQAKEIRFESFIESSLDYKMITKTEKRNLLLISKETINNSIKYADCSVITVQIRQIKGNLELTITDNGKGFDAMSIREGNGLKNIEQRAIQIHYHMDIDSRTGKGTTVKLWKK